MRVRDRRFSGTTNFNTGGRRRRSADVVDAFARAAGRGTVYYENTFDQVSICESGRDGMGRQALNPPPASPSWRC